jgi:hypothetical protein
MLRVTGDAASNQINVAYNGPGDLLVECDGTPYQFSEPVREVQIHGRGGDDSVTASIFAFDGALPSEWSIDLGNGDDSAFVFGEMLIQDPTSFALAGGLGDDAIQFGISAFVVSDLEIALDGGNGNDGIGNGSGVEGPGRTTSHIRGGNGNDSIFDAWDFSRIENSLECHVHGGNGADLVTARLGSMFELDPNLPLVVASFDVRTTGQAEYSVTGGHGDDRLEVNTVGRIDGRLTVVANGGSGQDEILAQLDIDTRSTGIFDASLRGGLGDDTITAQARFYETALVEYFPGVFLDGLAGFTETPPPLSQFQIVAHGGRGFDTCLHSDWITLIGIEDDQPI